MSNGKTPVVAEAHEVDTFRKMPARDPMALDSLLELKRDC